MCTECNNEEINNRVMTDNPTGDRQVDSMGTNERELNKTKCKNKNGLNMVAEKASKVHAEDLIADPSHNSGTGE